MQIARELGWGGADLEMLEFAALLHDVGKIGIPDAILHKLEFVIRRVICYNLFAECATIGQDR